MAALQPGLDDANPKSLQRRSTTKQLVSRYEEMSEVVRTQSSADAWMSTRTADGKRPAPPITKSIRQFISSAFKKDKEIKSLNTSQISAPQPIASYGSSSSSTQEYHQEPASHPVLTEATQLVTMHAGNLYHLYRDCSRSLDASPLPVWLECFVTLSSDRLSIAHHSVSGINLSAHTVMLLKCSDVCSLARDELEVDEKSLLPSDVELRVFELQFNGRQKEKFAAFSLQDRATWVSAIWYVPFRSFK